MNLSISTAESRRIARKYLYEQGRRYYRDLPWRHTENPWAILVSEVMLQQTQASRVAQRWPQWMERFPKPSVFASASLREVLDAWSGLGYNRRALNLYKAAGIIADTWRDEVPSSEEELLKLPGIGVYTARAVLAFAFDLPSVFLETNIRTVYIRHFFAHSVRPDGKVPDRVLLEIGAALIEADSESVLSELNAGPRLWYSALMDYGAWIKQSEGNFSRHAASYRSQAPFEGSERQLRGAVLKALLEQGAIDIAELAELTGAERARLDHCLSRLASEGFIKIEAAAESGNPAEYGISLADVNE
jgi:A/G-specific adenine glycosylase